MRKKTTWEKITAFIGHPVFQVVGWPVIVSAVNWLILNWNQISPVIIWWSTLLVVVLTLFIVNQIYAWKERTKKKLSAYPEEELERTIRDWLDWPTFSFTRLPPSNNQFFGFAFVDPVGKQVLIERQKSNPDILIIGAEISLGKIGQTTNDTHALLAVDLARLGIMFSFNNKNGNDIVEIHHSVPIADDLNMYRFRNAVMFVLRAIVMIGVLKDYLPKKQIDIQTKQG